MSDQNAQEPTMEEILASIRRIISEDEPAPASSEAETASPPHGDAQRDYVEEDILELTDRVEAGSPQEPVFEDEDDADFETSGDLEIYSRGETSGGQAAPAGGGEDEPPLVSQPTEVTASSAFGQLARTVTMPAEGRVLEDVVRELLRPLLKDWLDRNLSDIVEAAVQAEVERIARRRLS